MPRRFVMLLAGALLAPPVLHGAPQARQLKARCLIFGLDRTFPELYAHSVSVPEDGQPEGVFVRTRTYLNHEVEVLPMHGDRLVFTTAADRASIEDPERVIGRVTVPSGVRSAILVFLPGARDPGSSPCRVLPVEDTTRAFPRGSLKVINLSPLLLRLLLEKKQFDIPPGATRTIGDPPVGEHNASAMRAFTFKDDKWQRLGAGLWPHPGPKRVLQIAHLNPGSGQIEIRGIRDIAVRDPGE